MSIMTYDASTKLQRWDTVTPIKTYNLKCQTNSQIIQKCKIVQVKVN